MTLINLASTPALLILLVLATASAARCLLGPTVSVYWVLVGSVVLVAGMIAIVAAILRRWSRSAMHAPQPARGADS